MTRFFFSLSTCTVCLFVKNIVENDSFFFSSMAISSSSTFYTLIYKLCDLCLLFLLLLLLLLAFQVLYTCPSHLSNLSANVEYISLRLYLLLLLPPVYYRASQTASLARTTLRAWSSLRGRSPRSRDQKEFASRMKFAIVPAYVSLFSFSCCHVPRENDESNFVSSRCG
jgi:hypothetical protein